MQSVKTEVFMYVHVRVAIFPSLGGVSKTRSRGRGLFSFLKNSLFQRK